MFRDPDIRANIQDYLDELFELYEITDPAKGWKSEMAKLELARHSIDIWWRMHDELMLWAQSQIVGYCLAKNHQETLERLPILFGDEIDEDSHELELLGLQFVSNPVDRDAPELLAVEKAFGGNMEFVDAGTRRESIVELFVSGAENSSFWRVGLQMALEALNDGEVLSLVKPSSGRKQGRPFALKLWKREALRQVYFRLGKGLKKYRAIEEVASGVGQSPETLRDWEKEFLKSEVHENVLYCSRLAGKFESELKSGHYGSIPDYEDYGMYRGSWIIDRAANALKNIEQRTLDEIRENIRRHRKAQESGA